MSIPLNEKKRSEAPLIAFTLCTPAAVGVAVLASMLGFWSPGGCTLLMSAASLALATVGMLASVFHLAKPMRAPFSLRHLKSSWLSREIVAVAVFWAFAAAWLLGCAFANAAVFLAGELLAAASGVVLLFVITRAYKVSTRPAWVGAEGLMELVAAACGAGSATVLCCIFCGEAFGWVGGIPAAVLAARLAVLCVAQAAAFALDVASHRRRRMRLQAMAEESDERIPLTLANYGRLQPVLHKAWTVEGAAVAATCVFCAVAAIHLLALPEGAAASGAFASGWGPMATVAVCLVLAVLQFVAHGMQRWLFYEIPVPVRYVARLRK